MLGVVVSPARPPSENINDKERRTGQSDPDLASCWMTADIARGLAALTWHPHVTASDVGGTVCDQKHRRDCSGDNLPTQRGVRVDGKAVIRHQTLTNRGGSVASATLDEATYHAGLLESTERIAEILTSAAPALRVTTCPDWTLSELALHVGRAHRWAQRIIETRAQKPIDMSAVDMGLPTTTTRYRAWLCSGATAFSTAVQFAGTRTPVWSWSDDQSVGFWLRKITHDTIIHRIDAELTIGLRPSLPPQMASDGVADLLAAITTLSTVGHPDPIFEGLRGLGETLQLQATDTADEWFVTSNARRRALDTRTGRRGCDRTRQRL
jgi:uncharacterized protein (TIGR03083 family)